MILSSALVSSNGETWRGCLVPAHVATQAGRAEHGRFAIDRARRPGCIAEFHPHRTPALMPIDGHRAPGGFHRASNTSSTLSYMGSLLSFLVNSEEAGGALTFLIAEARKGSEPPPHVHAWEHEIFYMLNGEVDFFVEGIDHALRTRAGELVFLPRGKAHGMVFHTPTAKAVSVLHALDGHRVGIEAYLKEMSSGQAQSVSLPEVADRYSTIDDEAMRAAADLAGKHGVNFLSDGEIAERLPSFATRAAHGR